MTKEVGDLPGHQGNDFVTSGAAVLGVPGNGMGIGVVLLDDGRPRDGVEDDRRGSRTFAPGSKQSARYSKDFGTHT